MTLLDSLLDAIVRLDGDSLVMHVGEKPYVVTMSSAMNALRGPLAWGQVELSSRPLTPDAVLGMLGQILPLEQRLLLDEVGAIEHELTSHIPGAPPFILTAARGGDDVWVEVRRKPEPEPEPAVEPIAAPEAAASEAPVPTAMAERPAEEPVEVPEPLEPEVVAAAAEFPAEDEAPIEPPAFEIVAEEPQVEVGADDVHGIEMPAGFEWVSDEEDGHGPEIVLNLDDHEEVVHLDFPEAQVAEPAEAAVEVVAVAPEIETAAATPVLEIDGEEQLVEIVAEVPVVEEPAVAEAPLAPEPVAEAPVEMAAVAAVAEASSAPEPIAEAPVEVLVVVPPVEAIAEAMPIAEAPVAAEPVAEAPVEMPAPVPAVEAVAEAPIVPQPIAEVPVETAVAAPPVEAVAEAPVAPQPVAEAPVEAPVVVPPVEAITEAMPIAEAPAAPEPVAEIPAAPQPVAETPVEMPAPVPAVEAVAEAPIAPQPVAEIPVAPQPVAEAPIETPVVVPPVEAIAEALPIAEAPAAPEPVAEAPVEAPVVVPAVEAVAEAPVAPQPVAEVPVETAVAAPPVEASAEAPVAPQPVAEAPVEIAAVAAVAEVPSAPEPVAEAPVETPVVVPPVEAIAEAMPIAEAPIAPQPVAGIWAALQPVAEAPVTPQPVATAAIPPLLIAGIPVVPRPLAVAPPQPVAEVPVAPQPIAAAPRAPEPVEEVPQPVTPTERAERVELPSVVPMARPPLKLSPAPPAPAARAASTEASLVGLLKAAAARGASTLYAVADARPMVRVDGQIAVLGVEASVTAAEVDRFTFEFAPRNQVAEPASEWTCTVKGVGRVRCVTFHDDSGSGLIFHLPSTEVSTADELGLSARIQALCGEADGLVVIAGPRGSGKSTLLDAFVDLINRTRSDHVITIESHIRTTHEKRHSFISQRQSAPDGEAIAAAARAALREGPDVLVIEDLRAPEALSVALDAARAGRLVIGGIAAPTASAAVERLVGAFPADRRPQVRALLAGSLRAVIAQTLVRKQSGGRIAARELLLNSPAVERLILDGAFSQLPIAIDGGRQLGMVTMNDALGALVRDGVVDVNEACGTAPDRASLIAALERDGIDVSHVERWA